MTPAEMYIYNEKKSGFKVGDKVKVLQKAMDNQGGWQNSWVPEMDKTIGEIGTIIAILPWGDGIQIEFNPHSIALYYPYFVLGKVTIERFSTDSSPISKITNKGSTMWNTKCPDCGADAYQSALFTFECSNKDCKRR